MMTNGNSNIKYISGRFNMRNWRDEMKRIIVPVILTALVAVMLWMASPAGTSVASGGYGYGG